MAQASLGSEFFENIYAKSADPWNFELSAYENAKYRATIEALDRRQFSSAFEIGCSVGVLSALLAACCERLLAVDINARAIASATRRCRHAPNVRFAQMEFPRQVPSERFDAIIVSEVGYYWSDRDLERAIDAIARAGSGGIVELVHYLPAVDFHVRSGDAVHAAFLSDSRFTGIRAQRAPDYRIDVLSVR